MYERINELLNTYQEKAKFYLYDERNYERAMEYTVRALQCAELVEDFCAILDNRLLVGHIYLNSMNNLDYAVEIYTSVLDLLKEYESKEQVMDKEKYYYSCKYALARTLRKLGKLNQAIPILEEVAANLKDVKRRVSVLNDLGLTYWRKANATQNPIFFDEAIRAYELATELCTTQELNKAKAMVLNNKGMVCYDQHYYDVAIQAFDEALSLTNDQYYIACISNEVAKTYLKLGNFHMAKQFINKANQILIDYDKNRGEVELLRNLAIEGLYQRKIGNFEDAVNYFEIAASKLEDKELKIEAAETFHQLSLMLKERGDIRSGRYALKFEELAKDIEREEQRLV